MVDAQMIFEDLKAQVATRQAKSVGAGAILT